MRMRVTSTAVLFAASQNTKCLFHKEKGRETQENTKPGMDVSRCTGILARSNHPTRILRFSSTITKRTPDAAGSPMKEWGTRCRKTSDSKPPVYGRASQCAN